MKSVSLAPYGLALVAGFGAWAIYAYGGGIAAAVASVLGAATFALWSGFPGAPTERVRTGAWSHALAMAAIFFAAFCLTWTLHDVIRPSAASLEGAGGVKRLVGGGAALGAFVVAFWLARPRG